MNRKIIVVIAVAVFFGASVILAGLDPNTGQVQVPKSGTVLIDGNQVPITWSVDVLPEVQYKEMVLLGVAKGFEIWEQKNPTLGFERVEGPADIKVLWETEPSPHKVGAASYTVGSIEGTITIHLGNNDCNGSYVQWDMDAIANTTMHEIGHILQLGHHTDESHLMYGDDRFARSNFDDLGYAIPDNLGPQDYLVGERSIREDIDELSIRLAVLDKDYTSTIESRGMTVEDYESGRASTSSGNFDMNITQIIDEYNRLVYEYNSLVEVVHCLYNES